MGIVKRNVPYAELSDRLRFDAHYEIAKATAGILAVKQPAACFVFLVWTLNFDASLIHPRQMDLYWSFDVVYPDQGMPLLLVHLNDHLKLSI